MAKRIPTLLLLMFWSVVIAMGQSTMSFGVFTGITSSFSQDQGINADPRYKNRADLKFVPFGVSYQIDTRHHGFIISPSVFSIGSNYDVVDIFGRTKGIRKTKLKYFNIPISYKRNVIELASLNVSVVAGISIANLLKVNETISHDSAKYIFPEEVYPSLPSGYRIEPGGVIAPDIDNVTLSEKNDYRLIQSFASLGVRADWDFMPNWRFTVDVRGNFGLMEPRFTDYVDEIKAYQSLYDTPGARKDVFAMVTLGLSRVFGMEGRDPRYNSKKVSAPKSKPTRSRSAPKKRKR